MLTSEDMEQWQGRQEKCKTSEKENNSKLSDEASEAATNEVVSLVPTSNDMIRARSRSGISRSA